MHTRHSQKTTLENIWERVTRLLKIPVSVPLTLIGHTPQNYVTYMDMVPRHHLFRKQNSLFLQSGLGSRGVLGWADAATRVGRRRRLGSGRRGGSGRLLPQPEPACSGCLNWDEKPRQISASRIRRIRRPQIELESRAPSTESNLMPANTRKTNWVYAFRKTSSMTKLSARGHDPEN